MKKILSVLVGGLAMAAVPGSANAQAADPAEVAEARSIISVMFPPAERLAMITKMQDQMMAQMRPLLPAAVMSDPGLSSIMDDYIKEATARQRVVMQKRIPEMFDAMAEAYSHEFTLGELKDIHAFASTPSGKHYLSRSTAIIGDPAVAKVNTAMFKDIHDATQEMMPALKDKVMAYVKAHPDVAAKIEATEKKSQ